MKNNRISVLFILLTFFLFLTSFSKLDSQSSVKKLNPEIIKNNISTSLDTVKIKEVTYHAKDSVRFVKPNLVILYGKATVNTGKIQIIANKIIYNTKLSTVSAFDYSIKIIGFDRTLTGKECQINID